MDKRPVQELEAEHGEITIMLRIMEKVADKLRQGEVVEPEQLHRILEFLQIFADKCHHGKEEEVLFPELGSNPANLSMINELLGEHRAGRDLMRGIEMATGSYQTGGAEAFHLAANFESYITLLTEHIRKENMALLPLTDKTLSEPVQMELASRFKTYETKMIGIGKHAEYQGWLGEMKHRFLEGLQ